MRFHFACPVLLLSIVILAGCQGPTADGIETAAAYPQWEGPLSEPSFFPIMVWAQDTALAAEYKALGVNTYLALYKGPTEKQLADLREQGMYAICDQNEVGLAHVDDPTILAWMHGDEPDNYRREHKGPVPLETMAANYVEILANDPSRPVLVNFGQGIANEQFRGRALAYDRYELYAFAADIVSYDVYPVANLKYTAKRSDGSRYTEYRDDGGDLLWYVAKGVDRLREWTGDAKPVWNVLECTAISHPRGAKVNPHEMRAEVWMSLIHGSTGLCWFVHDFRPDHRNVAALLADEELSSAVTANNHLVTSLAPVLNSPTLLNAAEVASSDADVPIDVMVKRHGGATYVFAVAMRNGIARGQFRIRGLGKEASAEVIGEDRTLDVVDGAFADEFGPFDVHLYKITAKQ